MISAIVVSLAATACGTIEGPLLREADGGTGVSISPSGADAQVPTGDSTRPADDRDVALARIHSEMRMHYQITGTPSLDAAGDLFVLDLFDAPLHEIAALRARGRVVVAYLSAGSLEPWRPDADDFPEQAVGARLSAYPNERWLDIRHPAVRAVMQERLQLARDKGFDGIYPGALDAYRSQSGFALSERDQLDYDLFLAGAARSLGLSPGMSSDFSLDAQLIDAFDWAIAFGCFAADSCETLGPWVGRSKPMFDLEQQGELSELCPRASALGIRVVMKEPSASVWSRSCP